ncbi:MAG: beta-ketoacyl synthase N-terminal-like domain-containing protein, partial [Planctomycetota bacterium]
LEDANTLVAARAELMNSLPRQGAMAAVACPLETIEGYIQPHAAQLSVAAVNSKENLVLSGDTETLDQVLTELESEFILGTRLKVSHAFHSPLMQDILEPFHERIDELTYKEPQIPLYSGVSGSLHALAPDAEYWKNHISQTVRFADCVQNAEETADKDCQPIFLEVGPTNTLCQLTRRHLGKQTTIIASAPNKREEQWRGFCEAVAQVYNLGQEIHWATFHERPSARVPLPLYPFEKHKHWIHEEAPVLNHSRIETSPPVEAQSAESIETLIEELLQEHLSNAAQDSSTHSGFAAQGLGSLAIVNLAQQLGNRLGRTVSPTALFDHPTKQRLAAYLAGKQTSQSATTSLSAKQEESVAIVGLACRLPGKIASLDDLESLLERGGDAISEVPSTRWPVDQWYNSDPNALGSTYSRWGGFIDSADQFDARFFRMSPREAISTDPQHRLLLELTWEAFEDSGIAVDTLKDRRVGVFVGSGVSEYQTLLNPTQDPAKIDGFVGLGTHPASAAGRISHHWGFHGPALAVDTTCSSSLMALHLACDSLKQGDSEVAVVGGANLILTPNMHIGLSRVRALSPTGRCRTFDAAADGYTRSEGAVIVTLKRQSDAVRDGNRILGIVRGTASNHDGASAGYTVPNGTAQENVMKTALESANVSPSQIGYIECHGTGTPLGDPIEVAAINRVYGDPASPPLLGSVKANLGHTESVAGLTGLLKLLLCLRHGKSFRNPHLNRINPEIERLNPDLQLSADDLCWQQNDGERKRIGAISSFGMTGTNVHAIVEQGMELQPRQSANAQARPEEPNTDTSQELLLVSAQSEQSLSLLIEKYSEVFETRPTEWLNICRASYLQRTPLRFRKALVCSSADSALTSLREATTKTFGEPGLYSELKSLHLHFDSVPCGFDLNHLPKTLSDNNSAFREEWQAITSELTAREELPVYQWFALQLACARVLKRWGCEFQELTSCGTGKFAADAVSQVISVHEAYRRLNDLDGSFAGGSALTSTPSRDTHVQVVLGIDTENSVFDLADPRRGILRTLSRLFEAGADLHWHQIAEPLPALGKIDLPRTPWDHKRFWPT